MSSSHDRRSKKWKWCLDRHHISSTTRASGQRQGTYAKIFTLLRSSIIPKIVEPARTQLGIDNCILNIGMPHVALYCSGIMPLPCQIKSGAVAKHVGVDGESKFSAIASSGNYVTNCAA